MAEVPIGKEAVAALPEESMPELEEQQQAARSSSSSSSSTNARHRTQTQQRPPRQAMPPLQKELQKLPKEIVKALPGLKTPENYELALQGKAIKWKEYNFFEAFHVVRMEQTVGAKKRVEVTLSLEDYQKMPKRTKAFYKFVVMAVSYVLICKTCKHPRNPLIVNPEMKRKRPNTRRGAEAAAYSSTSPAAASSSSGTRTRSKSVGSAPEADHIEQLDAEAVEEMEREREERRRLRRERREKRAAAEEEAKKQQQQQPEAAVGSTEGADDSNNNKAKASADGEEKNPTSDDNKKAEDAPPSEVAKSTASANGEKPKEEGEGDEAKQKVEEGGEEKKADQKREGEGVGGKTPPRERKRSSGGHSRGKREDTSEDAEANSSPPERKVKRPEGGRAQDKVGGITPRAGTPNAPNMNAEVFSKQNNPYEYNSYDVYVEPCACGKSDYTLEFLIKTEISNKVGVSIGMLLLNLPTMGVAFALYSDGPVMHSRKMFAFDLLSTHEQNMSIKTVL
eukprot:TRINITY_DN5155_c0_g1_i2.p1 TRINITY_DN5155_c0_g1~~TRINITY_DN5155_c0_g1_i2.p1  ORF type:complete len:508 (-),score=182.59 TRINITY_DN5155_c0_g1_i2:203-1726(-)